eukprot:g19550.t1
MRKKTELEMANGNNSSKKNVGAAASASGSGEQKDPEQVTYDITAVDYSTDPLYSTACTELVDDDLIQNTLAVPPVREGGLGILNIDEMFDAHFQKGKDLKTAVPEERQEWRFDMCVMRDREETEREDCMQGLSKRKHRIRKKKVGMSLRTLKEKAEGGDINDDIKHKTQQEVEVKIELEDEQGDTTLPAPGPTCDNPNVPHALTSDVSKAPSAKNPLSNLHVCWEHRFDQLGTEFDECVKFGERSLTEIERNAHQRLLDADVPQLNPEMVKQAASGEVPIYDGTVLAAIHNKNAIEVAESIQDRRFVEQMRPLAETGREVSLIHEFGASDCAKETAFSRYLPLDKHTDPCAPWQEDKFQGAPGYGGDGKCNHYHDMARKGKLIGYHAGTETYLDYSKKSYLAPDDDLPLAFIVNHDETRIDNPEVQLRVREQFLRAHPEYHVDSVRDFDFYLCLHEDIEGPSFVLDPADDRAPEIFSAEGVQLDEFGLPKITYENGFEERDLASAWAGDAELLAALRENPEMAKRLIKDDDHRITKLGDWSNEMHSRIYADTIGCDRVKNPMKNAPKLWDGKFIGGIHCDKPNPESVIYFKVSDLLYTWYDERKKKKVAENLTEKKQEWTDVYETKLDSYNLYSVQLGKMIQKLGCCDPQKYGLVLKTLDTDMKLRVQLRHLAEGLLEKAKHLKDEGAIGDVEKLVNGETGETVIDYDYVSRTLAGKLHNLKDFEWDADEAVKIPELFLKNLPCPEFEDTKGAEEVEEPKPIEEVLQKQIDEHMAETIEQKIEPEFQRLIFQLGGSGEEQLQLGAGAGDGKTKVNGIWDCLMADRKEMNCVNKAIGDLQALNWWEYRVDVEHEVAKGYQYPPDFVVFPGGVMKKRAECTEHELTWLEKMRNLTISGYAIR